MNVFTAVQSEEEIRLRFTQGSSDKIYQAQLKFIEKDPDNGGWIINFQYGRRGSALKAGCKTPKPLNYIKAKAAYDKLIASKLSKGYTPNGSGIPFSGTAQAGKRTIYLPQLLNQVTKEEALALWGTIDMYLQIKYDGERRGIIYDRDAIIGANRKGLEVPLIEDIPQEVRTLLGGAKFSGIFDTEDMGEYLVIFDMIHGMEDVAPFSVRAEMMELFDQGLTTKKLGRLLFELPYKPKDKADFEQFIDTAKKNNEEGIVIRDGAGIYFPGRPASGGPCWKLKFYADATCIVESVHPSKRSIGLGLYPQGCHPIGNCTIPANYKIPETGDLVEIRYLYAYKDGSLYQPQYKGVRTDINPEACGEAQLKYKKET
jgi:bifunctional non-homologous end joining protein LigD